MTQATQQTAESATSQTMPEEEGKATARRRAEEMNVDLAEVHGTGQDGQITVDDLRKKAQEEG
jgi:pyruvate/2-oxoglutarate dehydrogenase complex dihydrolipoamide acyltransferase (E2) component